jgi:hypothetical protein
MNPEANFPIAMTQDEYGSGIGRIWRIGPTEIKECSLDLLDNRVDCHLN